MSFLKQLLTPFIEFDADNQQGQQVPPATPATPAPPAKTPAGTKPTPPSPPQPAPQVKPTPPPPQPPTKPKAAAPVSPTPPKPAPAAVPPQASMPAAVRHPIIDAPPASAGQQVPVYSPSGTLVEPLPEHVQYFEKLIDEANRTHPYFQGADYKEFVDSKLDIDDIQDEALKYRTAYNVLKNSGLTREKLLLTGQEYQNLVGRDMNLFQGAYALKYRRELGEKEKLVQQKAAELQVLVQRMNALKAEINQLTQDVNLTKEQLDTVKASFLLAGEKKQQEIDIELQKIAQYF